jgi:ubiquinone/menaquinone biosynthesis C-methylase UbiE
MDEVEIDLFDRVEIGIDLVAEDGVVLDIGGGGEGVIGRVHRVPVVAIDRNAPELREAPDGAIKVVMDATDLLFLDETFATATAFFTFMYIPDEAEQRSAMAEALRVLKPGGALHLWDCSVDRLPQSSAPGFGVQLRILLAAETIEVTYGAAWPNRSRSPAYYRELAESVGFIHQFTVVTEHVFHMAFQKAPN